jgi:hypothetical protein
VRLAILISLAAMVSGQTPAPVSDALVPCEVGGLTGYLVPASYAEAHRTDMVETLPDGATVDGFWTVSEQAAVVADRKLREKLEDAENHPTLLFPNLKSGGEANSPDSVEFQSNEIRLTLEHYDTYYRQYVGLILHGRQYVLLNLAAGPKLDPARGFIFIQRVFEPGRMHFLQARFDWDEKKISNVSFYGTWQEASK